MYDTSPESWAHGAVDRLLFITRALSYFEYKAKRKHGSGAESPSLEKLCHVKFPRVSAKFLDKRITQDTRKFGRISLYFLQC